MPSSGMYTKRALLRTRTNGLITVVGALIRITGQHVLDEGGMRGGVDGSDACATGHGRVPRAIRVLQRDAFAAAKK